MQNMTLRKKPKSPLPQQQRFKSLKALHQKLNRRNQRKKNQICKAKPRETSIEI